VSERPDGVASAWRIVERVLVPQNAPDVYAPGTWGPAAAARLLPEGDAWHDPAPA
jgi:glucose-6-phosphate 1-dehydrogenase